MFGLRHNTEENGGSVPRFEGGDMIPGYLLGGWAAAGTSVGRSFESPSGFSGPEKTIRNERFCLCFWCFVSSKSRSALGEGNGNGCCFLFSRCSHGGAAQGNSGGDGDWCTGIWWSVVGRSELGLTEARLRMVWGRSRTGAAAARRPGSGAGLCFLAVFAVAVVRPVVLAFWCDDRA